MSEPGTASVMVIASWGTMASPGGELHHRAIASTRRFRFQMRGAAARPSHSCARWDYWSVRFDHSAAWATSGHSRSASPRENGLVARPRYRLPTSVVPCTIIGASVAEALRSRHRPAMNIVSGFDRYRPSTVEPPGRFENHVTFAGR